MRTREEIDKIYSESELLEKILTVNNWYHVINFGTKVKTPGNYSDYIREKNFSAIPDDLTGKSVLDIGAYQGMFSFECERRNAKEIVASDIYDTKWMSDNGIKLCKDILDSKIDIIPLSVYDVDKLNRKFDIILFFGVLYAIQNPILALEKLFDICNELVIVEAEVIRTDRSICYVLEKDEIQKDLPINFLFSPKSLENIALKIGFKKVDFLGYSTDQITPIQSDIVSSDEK